VALVNADRQRRGCDAPVREVWRREVHSWSCCCPLSVPSGRLACWTRSRTPSTP